MNQRKRSTHKKNKIGVLQQNGQVYTKEKCFTSRKIDKKKCVQAEGRTRGKCVDV